MATAPTRRDYSLIGRDAEAAVASGLAAAEWYKTDIPRKRMKELMQRSDGPAIRDTIIWIAGFVVFGDRRLIFWGTWWAVPFFICYGVLYGSSTDSRWHECGHGTAFKTRWLNDAVYQVACFMIMREPTIWRWSHTRHHTDTIIVGRDPEIAAMRPPAMLRLISNYLRDLPARWNTVKHIVLHSLGRLDAEESDLRAGDGARQGVPRRPHLARHPRRRDRAGAVARLMAAADVCRRAADHVWRLADGLFRRDPACRPRRERARPSPQLRAPST